MYSDMNVWICDFKSEAGCAFFFGILKLVRLSQNTQNKREHVFRLRLRIRNNAV